MQLDRLGVDEIGEATKMMLEALKENYITDVEIEMNIALDTNNVSDAAGSIIEQQLRDLIADRNAAVFAARMDGTLVGYAIVVIEGDVADFWDLVVKKEYRRMGIGSSLIAEVENFAKGRGCRAIKLDVNIKNEAAVELYENLGYRKVSIMMMKGDRINGIP
ncbi:MAG: GNAT family N-acetyltransferase [Nitrososphaeria archaeon]